MTVYHANFTYDGDTIQFLWFNYQGNLELMAQYRKQLQAGIDGAEAIKLKNISYDFSGRSGIANADYTTLKAMEGQSGTFVLRGESVTARLRNVVKIRGVNPSNSVDGNGDITTTYSYWELQINLTIESE